MPQGANTDTHKPKGLSLIKILKTFSQNQKPQPIFEKNPQF